MIEFGVRLPAGGPVASVEGMARVAREAERLGYDAVWVHDFIVWTKHQERTHVSCGSIEVVEESGETPPIFYESLTNLAWLAGITQRIRLGIAVLCVPYRNPIVTAKQLANIDLLSAGRLVVGIGVGGAKSGNNLDFEVLGVPRKDKWERSIEYVQIMREIWTDEKPSFDGRFVSFPATDINPKPVQKPHPPIWGSGRMRRSMEVTAACATGWLPAWIPAEGYPQKIEELRALARERGRDDASFEIGNEIYACIAPTGEGAHEKSDRTMAVLTEGFGANPEQSLIRACVLVGSPDQITQHIGRYVDAGVRHFELKFVYHTIPDFLEQLRLFYDGVVRHFR